MASLSGSLTAKTRPAVSSTATSISRFFYVVLTAVVMTGSVMVSYTRARAECMIPKCKAGFMERPERMVLLIIGALFNRMAPVLWVIAVIANITVVHRMLFTWRQTQPLERNRQTAVSHQPSAVG